MIKSLLMVAIPLLLLLHLSCRGVEVEYENAEEPSMDVTNGASWHFIFWPFVQYGVRAGVLYALYTRFTILKVAFFLLKYVSSGYYLYELIKSILAASKERINRKQQELEDIQLQIQIVNTKLAVREAEFTERAEHLKRGSQRLRAMQARVRGMLADDEELRRALGGQVSWDSEPELHGQPTNEEDSEFIIALPDWQTGMDGGEHATTEANSAEESIYSSLSEGDSKKMCRVKVVKVTNVYKVAYLKHYIKQKRSRRASKQAVLKKKIEGIMKLLEDWQKSLSMVINSKIMMDTTQLDVASQEAMGDYSKPNLRESSDSDSDLREHSTDMSFDEYNLAWSQNPHKNFSYNYEDIVDPLEAKEFHNPQDFEVKSQSYPQNQSECNGIKEPNLLFILPEETSSQMAIEEIKSETGVDFESEYI